MMTANNLCDEYTETKTLAWIKTKDLMPTPGMQVQCKLRHCSSGNIQQHLLVHVAEDDCSWRTAGDLCEVSYDWDVIEWEST